MVKHTRHLTTAEAAKVLGVSTDTVRRWADDGLLRHLLMPSGQRRFRREDLDAVVTEVEPRNADASGSETKDPASEPTELRSA